MSRTPAPRWWALVLIASLAPLGCLKREVRPPNDTGRSPDVHADGTVTFQLRAPQAKDVRVKGDFLGPDEARTLDRAADGTFSVTVGPLTPDIYTYSFDVDGVKTLDPRNAWIKSGQFFESKFAVSDGNAYFDRRDVPHGTLHVHTYRSEVANALRQVIVYTPPGFDPQRRYPVLYLINGLGDDHTAWTLEGRVDAILDNLLAANQATPMLIAMPNAHTIPYGGDMMKNFEAFPRELERHVIPLVERAYPVAEGPKQRAIGGLSMGAGQSLLIGLSHPDRFGAILSFSAGVSPQMVEAIGDGAALKQRAPLLVLASGAEDPMRGGSRRLASELDAKGVRYQFLEVPGVHTWRVWRNHLNQTLPLLFKSP